MRKNLLLLLTATSLNAQQIQEIEIGESASIDRAKMEQELSVFLDQPLDKEKLQEIKQAVESHAQARGYPLTIALVEARETTYGSVKIVVVASLVGEISIQGNRWTNKKILQRYVNLKPGDLVNEGKLSSDLNFMNRNPFRSVSAIYSAGKKPKTTDITFASRDQKPWLIYAGAQNNGIVSTGRSRYFTGITFGRMWDADQIFTYQYTTSSDFHKFQAHTIQAVSFFPWKHLLDVYGGYSAVHPDSAFEAVRSHGQSGQASFRYVVPLTYNPRLIHEIGFGSDWKRMNNTVEFSEGTPIFGKNVNLFQLIASWKGNYRTDTALFDFKAEAVGSPGKWLPDQTNADYESLRPEAKNHWLYGRGFISYLQNLPKDFSLYFDAWGQLSSTNLLPSEQLGIGGADTVRGYNERELNKDVGLITNFEARSPPIKVLGHRWKNIKDQLQFLVFYDFGFGTNHTPIPGEPKRQYLMGTGPGIRYLIGTNLNVRLDWGIRLHTHNPGSLLHFSVIGSY